MMPRKLLLFALVLLLISMGTVAAQSSTNYTMERFVTIGGSLADSAHYRVTSVFGQPATDVVDSPNYKVSAGFLYPASGFDVWLPMIAK